MSEQSQSPSVFDSFVGRFVKVLYLDGDKTAIQKGFFSKHDDLFVFISGNNEKIISKSSIQKIERG